MTGFREFLHFIRTSFTWWIVVAPWEQGVRVRLGKNVKLLEAGVHLKIPFVDLVAKQSVRLRIISIPPQTISTRDGHSLTIGILIGYKIVDVLKLYDSLHHAQDTITSIAIGAVSDFVIARDKVECAPDQLTQYVRDNVDLEQYGLGDTTVNISTFAFVRTYRIISGEGQLYFDGDSLSTNKFEGVRNHDGY